MVNFIFIAIYILIFIATFYCIYWMVGGKYYFYKDCGQLIKSYSLVFIVVPTILFIASLIISACAMLKWNLQGIDMSLDFAGTFISTIVAYNVFAIFIAFPRGSYEHVRKDGKRDLRYKSNIYSDETSSYAGFLWATVLIFIFYGAVYYLICG